MTLPIDGSSLPLLEPNVPMEGGTVPPQQDEQTGIGRFEDFFGEAISAHSTKAREAAQLAESFAAGKTEDIHGTMIAIKEVEIELRVISNVRRKVVDAFQELWRMNI